MKINYKIEYEHRDGNHSRAEEIFLESEEELTVFSPEVMDAVRKDAARFHKEGLAGLEIRAVVPVP